MRASLSLSLSPANCKPWTFTGPSGGAGRSVQTASTGLLSTGTSSAPAFLQALARRSVAADVCNQGSNPRRSPAVRCAASQVSGGGSASGSIVQAVVSTCLAACKRVTPVHKDGRLSALRTMATSGGAGKARDPRQALFGRAQHIRFAGYLSAESRIRSVAAAAVLREMRRAARSARRPLRGLQTSEIEPRTSLNLRGAGCTGQSSAPHSRYGMAYA